MKKFIYFMLISVVISSCSGLQTPETPKLTALQTVNGYTQTDSFAYVYNLNMVNLSWDVSMIPDAIGVDIILARDKNCKTVMASVKSGHIDSTTEVMAFGFSSDGYNPIENLGALFQSQMSKITATNIYVCIKSVSSSGAESGASYPVTVSLLQY